MSTQTATEKSRTFDGEMSAEFELWLGDAFNSWLPSRRMVEVYTPAGLYQVAAGDTITRWYNYTVYVTPPQIASGAVTEVDLIVRLGSLSSSAIRRILDEGAAMIERRAEDGVFE